MFVFICAYVFVSVTGEEERVCYGNSEEEE